MRRRTLRLMAELHGFKMPLGEISIQKFADVRKAETVLVCPKCGVKPAYSSGYDCTCGAHYSSYQGLKRIVPDTMQEVLKPKLTTGETEPATVLVMPATEFAEKYADGTLDEHGIIAKDQNTAINLRKLLVAVERLGKVVIVLFNDTNEQRIALLSLNMSNRVILKEIIPLNLAEISETLKVDVATVTEQDITEATALIGQLPLAKEENLMVSDYRTIGLKEGPVESPKVQSLKEILAQMDQKAAPTA